MRKVEGLLKAKELECSILDRKVKALRQYVRQKDTENERNLISDKKNYLKQVGIFIPSIKKRVRCQRLRSYLNNHFAHQ